MKVLLDTHVILWWLEGGRRLSSRHQKILQEAGPASPLRISDISLREIATLHSLGRIEFRFPLRSWLEKATASVLGATLLTEDARIRDAGLVPTI